MGRVGDFYKDLLSGNAEFQPKFDALYLISAKGILRDGTISLPPDGLGKSEIARSLQGRLIGERPCYFSAFRSFDGLLILVALLDEELLNEDDLEKCVEYSFATAIGLPNDSINGRSPKEVREMATKMIAGN